MKHSKDLMLININFLINKNWKSHTKYTLEDAAQIVPIHGSHIILSFLIISSNHVYYS